MRIGAVTIDLGLLGRLEEFAPKSVGAIVVWQNYRIRGDAPMPVVFKGPLDKPLSPDTVYYAHVRAEKGERARSEPERKTLDHLTIRFHPAPEGTKSEGVLHYVECAKDEGFAFRRGKPAEVIRLAGRTRKGILYVLRNGETVEVEAVKGDWEVLFAGPVVVMIAGGTETWLPNNAVRVVVERSGSDEPLVIYDHRKDRVSPLAFAEHIRKKIGRRGYEFFNLRDFVGQLAEVGHVLTNVGIITVQEFALLQRPG